MAVVGSEKPLVLSSRLHTMIRSISGVLDAGVELVTNSHDAYQKDVRAGNRLADEPCLMLIDIDYQNHLFTVTDNAIGMSAEEMERKLSVVGSYTSEEGVRGYFSRGAKDLISIGNVYFTAIKDGKLSELELTIQSTVITYRQDVPVTSSERALLKIPGNGLRVELRLLKNVSIPPLERVVKVKSFFNLRDIFGDPTNNVHMTVHDKEGKVVHDERLLYHYPAVKDRKLIDTVFELPGWGEDAVAHFELFELEEALPAEQISNQRQYGVLVCTDTTIHSNEGFYSDILGNPYFKRVRGRVTCNFIDKLMYQFEHEPINEKNMFPCVKSDRSGLNRRHQFVKDLYRTCYYMLRHVLQNEFKRKMQADDMLLDITDILNAVDFPVNNDKFVYDPDNICPYSAKNKELNKKEKKYLAKNSSNVKTQSPDAVYDFQNLKDRSDVEERKGHWKQLGTNMQILINSEESFTTPSRYYFLERVLVVEVNADDALVSKCVSLDETKTAVEGTKMYRIEDEVLFLYSVCRLVATALAACVNQARMNQYTDNEIKNFTPEDIQVMRDELEYMMLPGVFELLSSSEVVRAVVVNDVVEDGILD
jgi:hypothetical protein